MIVKSSDYALEIRKLEALERRLPDYHPNIDYIRRALSRKKAGMEGEQEIHYPLSLLDENKYYILHNLRLADQNGYFQMDTLLLNEKFILILEVKNWQGKIIFGENGQVIREYQNQEEGFPNPISQAKTQQYRLQRWLYRSGITPLPPIEYFVVLISSSTILKTSSPDVKISNKIIYNHDLFNKILEIDQTFVSAQRMKEIQNVAEKLKQSHVPLKENILEQYGFHISDLIKGVFCPKCHFNPMVRRKKKWFCERCKHLSTDAHVEALDDYSLLVGSKITNREARDFLQIESPHVTRRLLKRGLIFTGNTKARTYLLSP